MNAAEALHDRSADITRWVTECLRGMDVLAKPPSILNPYELVDFYQPIPFTSSEIGGSKAELQDVILKRVQEYVTEASLSLVTREADPSCGFKVEVTKNVTGHPGWKPPMAHYACYLKWEGPKPRFWPLQMGCGVVENPLSVTPAGASVKMPGKKQRWFEQNAAPRRKKHG